MDPATEIPYDIVLASGSPRRKELLAMLGLDFTVKVPAIEEDFPDHLRGADVACYLAELKASAFENIGKNEMVITADTIVCLDEYLILNKPGDFDEAFRMLSMLSGRKHEVITAVCLKSATKQKTIHVTTSVYFKQLREQEIEYYINNFKPYDKAGAYGIQEWIGLIGIEKIEGSYFNVVGLPVKEVYDELMNG